MMVHDRVKAVCEGYYGKIEKLLEEAIERRLDLAVSELIFINDLVSGCAATFHYQFIDPSQGYNLPTGMRWTIYHSGG